MSKSKWIFLVVVAIVAVVVFTGKDKGMDSMEETLIQEENAVLIMDQQPGETTVVSYAKLSKPGYVVVYSQDAAGNKQVLGTSDLLNAGEHKNITVVHSGRMTQAGDTVSAVVVADDGDETYTESDSEVLVETTTDESMAEISLDAVLDENISDEVLGDILEDAGYTVVETEMETTDEVMESENDTEMTSEETVEMTDESMESTESEETMTESDEMSGDESTDSSVEISTETDISVEAN